ncbi:MAG: hypothetical protein R6U91_09150 [Bacillota bacterium]
MTYQVKKTFTSIISGVIVLGVYLLYAFDRYQSGLLAPDDLKSWAQLMLIFIGVGIAATIVIQIFFHIMLSISIAIKENIKNGGCADQEIENKIQFEIVEDEMDKLIELKSLRVGVIVAGAGFVISLIILVLSYHPMFMLNTVFISFSFGSILEGFTKLYYYKRGI